MIKDDCIFCKIVDGKIPSYKIYEDDDFLGILDVFPNTKGMALLMPKEHYDSYVFEMPDDIYVKYMQAAKKLGKKIDEVMGVQRTAIVMEGMGVNHAHIKFYPLHGLGEKWENHDAPERKFFDRYQGYLSTLMGPQAKDEDLKEVQKLFQD